jgi:sterol desaturase/sphingolipid hydroxylase (fatty acid hydroxylase superfamily)
MTVLYAIVLGLERNGVECFALVGRPFNPPFALLLSPDLEPILLFPDCFPYLAEDYWGITTHFLFHGCHHKYPLDPSRLVFPPLPAAAVSGAIIGVLHLFVPRVRKSYKLLT